MKTRYDPISYNRRKSVYYLMGRALKFADVTCKRLLNQSLKRFAQLVKAGFFNVPYFTMKTAGFLAMMFLRE